MTVKQRAAFKQKLLEVQRELAQKGPARVEPNRASALDVGDAEDEQPLNEMLQSVASGRNRNLAQVVTLVVKALKKIEDDPEDYGQCEDCDEPIPLPRLNAMPYAAFCIPCQTKADGPRFGPTRRKITDYR